MPGAQRPHRGWSRRQGGRGVGRGAPTARDALTLRPAPASALRDGVSCTMQGTGMSSLAKGKPRVVFPGEYLALHPFLEHCSPVGPGRGGGERSCATRPSSRGGSRLFPAPHPLTAGLRRSQLPHLFIYQSVMSAEDAFEALLVISLAGKEILHILVFYSF